MNNEHLIARAELAETCIGDRAVDVLPDLIAALRAEKEAREQAETERDDAYVRGMAAGQAAMPKGTLTVIDSPEIMALRKRVERAEAALAAIAKAERAGDDRSKDN